jgi:hypothetical protein
VRVRGGDGFQRGNPRVDPRRHRRTAGNGGGGGCGRRDGLAGTDAGQGPHGIIVDQIAMLAEAGLPVTAAIGAGSWAARRWLGLACLESGAPADLVLCDADPRADLDVLRRAALIVMDGQVIESRAHSR